MNFAFSEEQEALRATARSFLAEHSPPEQVRRAMASELGFDPALWKRIGSELGWTGVAIPEVYGGLGLGSVELVALLEAMGEVLLCAPFLSSVCLAGNALLEGGSEAQKRELLPGIASGETLAALAWAGPEGGFGADAVTTGVRRDGSDFLLWGRPRYVVDGHCAGLLLVAARAEGGEVDLFAVPGDVRGLRRRALPTMDQTRRLAELELDGVRVPAAARLGEMPGGGGEALARTLDLAAVALAAEQVGGAQRCLDLAVAHARQRVQFGRPIGSFQAIQHKCADMLLWVESARSAAYAAGCAAAEGGDLPLAASLARAYASDAYFRCAAEALQIHGGVGFTWEYDVHLYLKRARSSEVLLGDPAWHRERVAQRIGL